MKNTTLLHTIHKYVGSSETIRKTPLYTSVFTQPFDFHLVMEYIPQHIKQSNYSPEFFSWFVGFTEGDGSFFISGERLFFTITQQDAPLLYCLRTQLGFGRVYSDTLYPDIKRYVVTDQSHIRILIDIFNGNLLLKKTNTRFSKWVHAYNRLTGSTIPVISRWNPKLELAPDFDFSRSRDKMSFQQTVQLRRNSVIWQTSWFTGFLEAEAGFSAVQRFKQKTDREKTTELRFLLDQTNELEVLSHIRDVLGDIGTIWIRKTTDDKIHYRYDVSNWDALQLIIGYANGHPLRSKKNIVYVRWKKILNYLDLLKKEKQAGTFVSSEKRQQRINRLVTETKKAFLNQECLEKLKREVEDRVPF